MRILSIDDNVKCSCVRSRCGVLNFNSETVINRMEEMFPGQRLLSLPATVFVTAFKTVTVTMVKEGETYSSLTPENQQNWDINLEDRCGVCHLSLVRILQKKEQAASKAA